MSASRHLLGRPLSARLLAWGGVLAVETAALRLVYPFAIVLVEQAWAGTAVVLAVLSLGLSVLRGWTADRVTRIVRDKLFDSISSGIENYPALAPPGSPPVEQLESEIARGVPWIESLVGVTAPAIFGNALALPVIVVLSWVRVGTRATLVASLAMMVGVAVGAVVARRVGMLGDAAWSGYQPIARRIESGFRGRIELAVHGRSGAHRSRLLAEVAHWSGSERRAFVWGGIAGWSVPIATALTAAGMSALIGADPRRLLEQIIHQPSRSMVVAGLLALCALPVLSAFSRGLAEWSTEWPHFRALEDFVRSVSGSTLQRKGSLPPVALRVGRVCVEQVRFAYPARRSGEPRSTVNADVTWQAEETLAISGANGCGKTTLTWLLMGIIEPEAGTIRVEIDGSNHPPGALSGRIAYLPQQPYFDDQETVRDAIRFVAPDARDTEIEGLISELLEGHYTGGVQTFLERRVTSLSMGERRAVALARVLLRRSDLTILDEPEANLDGELRERVIAALQRVKSHCRMLIVTHDPAFAEIADRVHRLPPGYMQKEAKSRSAAE